jgi:PST family polysaccharide transporter
VVHCGAEAALSNRWRATSPIGNIVRGAADDNPVTNDSTEPVGRSDRGTYDAADGEVTDLSAFPALREPFTDPLDAILDRHDAAKAKASTGRSARRGARIMGLANVAGQVTRMIGTLVLANLLVPQVFGVVSLVMVVTGFFERFLGDTGTSAAVVREKALTQRMASSVFWLNIAVGFGTSLFFIVLGWPIASLLGAPEASHYVRFLGLSAFLNALMFVQRSMLRRQAKFRVLAISSYLNVVVTLGLSAILAIAGFEVWALVIGNLSGTAAGAAVLWIGSSWMPAPHFAREDLHHIRNYSANITAYNFFGYFVNSGDRLIVGRLLGTEALGIYGMANRLLRIPIQSGVQSYREVALPMLSKLQDDNEAMGRLWIRSVSALFFVMAPLTVTVSVLADPLVRALLNDNWVPAIPVISIIALVATLQAITVTTGSIYFVTGRTDLWLRWGIVSAVVTMGGYLIGTRWGTVGVAAGFLVAMALLTYPSLKISFGLIGLKVRVLARAVAPTLAATALSAITSYTASRSMQELGLPALAQLVVGGLAGAVVYGCWTVFLRPQAFDDVISLAQRRPGALGVPAGQNSADNPGIASG